MAKKIAGEIVTSLFALLFVYAAVNKIIDYETFRVQLGRAPYIGQFSGLSAILIPFGELIIVSLLLFHKTRIIGLWASFAAMLVFTIYIALMLLSGLHLPCTCGGLISKLSWKQHLIFNGVLSVISVIGIIGHKNLKDAKTDSRYNFMVQREN